MQFKHFKDFVKGRGFSTSNQPENQENTEELEKTTEQQPKEEKQNQFSADDIEKMMSGNQGQAH